MSRTKRTRSRSSDSKVSNKKQRGPMRVVYRYDMLSSNETVLEFLKYYGNETEGDDIAPDDYEKINELFEKSLRQVYNDQSWKLKIPDSVETTTSEDFMGEEYLNISNINIGDKIDISYSPSSQKYIDYYDEQRVQSAIVLFIDVERDDGVIVCESIDKRANKKTVTFKSIEREGSHFLGMCRCYDYFITRID